jgi:RNA polymerase sigma-70 factor (ECF subfamily)
MSEHPVDASAWLPAAHAGCREALGQALEACRGYLLHVAERELDPELRAKGGASDLVQQTFLEAQRDFAHFQGNTEADLLAWLRHLLRHNLGKFRRAYRRTQKRGVGREVSLDAGRAGGPRGEEVPADGSSPSEQAVQHEQDEALERALEGLPEDYRQVIRLRYKEDRSFEEIAGLIGRSAEAARKLWARAVKRLQQELEGP